jgi:hypothetical protein
VRCLAVALLLASGACANPPASPPPSHVAVTRALGTFHGRGDQTIGVVSESGRLRISWQTSNERPGQARFRLTLHSGVSGRPLHLIADQSEAGGGTREVADDPRPFNLMVESANLDWSFSVEEIVAAPIAAARDTP